MSDELTADDIPWGGRRPNDRPMPQAAVKPFPKPKPIATLELTAVGALLEEPEDLVNWLVEGLIPAGSVCLLAAKPKIGKSTLARDLTFAHARGEPWLGQACSAGTAWYLAFEGRRRDIRAHFRQMGATANDPIWIYVGQAPKNVIAAVRERANQEHPTLIVIDTMQRFLRATSTDDYAEMTTLLDAVLAIVQQSGATLLLLHHSSKTDRASIDAVLGSTAITGSVDNIIMLARTARYRTITTVQRIGDDLDERVLELNELTGRVRLGPTREAKDRQVVGEQLYDALDDAGRALTQVEWFEMVEGRKSTKLAALRDLLTDDPVLGTRITRSGAGTRNNPYRYTPVSDLVSGSLVPQKTGNQNLFSSSSDGLSNESSDLSGSRVPAQEPVSWTAAEPERDDDERF